MKNKNWSLPPMLWYYENGCMYKKLKFQAWSDVEWIEYIPPTWDFTVLPPLTLTDTPTH